MNSDSDTDRSADKEIHRWYRIHRWETKIEPVEVVSWTAQFVTYIDRGWGKPCERRVKKDGTYFESWEAAYEVMVQRARDGVRHAEENLQRRKSELGTVLHLKKDAP